MKTVYIPEKNDWFRFRDKKRPDYPTLENNSDTPKNILWTIVRNISLLPDSQVDNDYKTLLKDYLESAGNGFVRRSKLRFQRPSDPRKPTHQIIGAGLANPSELNEGFNGGPRVNSPDDVLPVGKYWLCLGSLGKNTIRLLTKSGNRIPRFPDEVVSTALRRMVLKLAKNHAFEQDEYDDLNDHEKEVYDALLAICDGESRIGGALLKRRRTKQDEERDALIERFNVLRGELLSGNNAPEIIKELKPLLFKLKQKGIVSQSSFNEVILYLLTV